MNRPTRKKWRLNIRAAIIVGVVTVVGLVTVFALSYVNTMGSTTALLRQAETQAQADPPRYDLALSFLNEYLKTLEPDDPKAFEALRQKSEILERTAFAEGDYQQVIRTCQQALRAQPKDAEGEPTIDPHDPGVLEVRRRMVAAFVATLSIDSALSVAESVARELVDRDRNEEIDPAPKNLSHTEALARAKDIRQLGTILNAKAYKTQDPATSAEAREMLEQSYQAMLALVRDGSDQSLPPEELDRTISELITGASDLAILYQFGSPASNTDARARLTAQAETVMDDLLNTLREVASRLKARDPEASIDQHLAQAHLARSRRLSLMAEMEPLRQRRDELIVRAERELELALQRQPENADVLLAAAEYNVSRGNVRQARSYFDKVPLGQQETLKGRLIQGLIDLGANQPDNAIASWRRGLEGIGGADTDLTWQLAYVLLDQERLDEAEPLIRQHRRLSGGEEPTPQHRFLQGLQRIKKNQLDDGLEELKKVVFAEAGTVNDRFKAQAHLLMAQAYENKGEIVEAGEQYRQATRLYPQWALPYLSQAEMQRKNGNLSEALDTIESGLIEMPSEPVLNVAKARALMGIELGKPPAERDWSQTEATLAEARLAAPTNVAVARATADLKAVQGDLNGAAAVLEQAVRHNPNAAELWVAWASVLIRMNQTESALIVLQQAAAPGAAGDHASIRIATAQVLGGTGKGQQAIKLLERDRSNRSSAEQAQLLAALGSLHRQRGQIAEARAAYEAWAKLTPDNPQPLIALVELADMVGDRDAARTAQTALEALGTNTPLTRVAQIQKLLGQHEEGEDKESRLAQADVLITELETNPATQRAGALMRGLYHERREEAEAAIDAYRKALESGAANQAASRLIVLYSKLGRVDDLQELRQYLETGDLAAEASGTSGFDRLSTAALLAAGRTEEAEQIAAQIVAGNPDSLDARVWQARVLNTAGKPEQAEMSLRELAEQSTEAGPWLTLLAFQVTRQELDDARATLERIKTTVKAENPELLWAQCSRLIGDLPAAEAAFETARARNPEDQAVLAPLANFYETTGQIERAVTLLREVVEKKPDARWAARPLALLRSRQVDGWDEAWELAQLPEGAEDAPEERLTRALVLARSPEKPRQDEALSLFESLLADLPPSSPIVQASREVLARIYLTRGENTKLANLTAVNAVAGTNPQAIALHGEVLLRAGQISEARAQLQRLEQAAPREIVTAKLRALVLKAENKIGEAAASLQKAFEEHRQSDPDGGRSAGREFLLMFGAGEGDPGRRPAVIPDQEAIAEAMARELATAWPADSWLLGRVLARQGSGHLAEALDACLTTVNTPGSEIRDRREAAALAVSLTVDLKPDDPKLALADQILQKARDAEPDNPELMILQGYLRHAQQRYQEESDLYTQARGQRPVSPLYLNNLAWGLGQELGKPSEGLEVIDSLLATIRDDSRFDETRVQCLDTRGVILTNLGEYADAIADLQKVVERTPDNPVYQYHLARAYALDGQDEKFREHLDLARKAGLTPEKLEPSEREEMQKLMSR